MANQPISQDDLVSAREQRSHIAIIQMAPPAAPQSPQVPQDSSTGLPLASNSAVIPSSGGYANLDPPATPKTSSRKANQGASRKPRSVNPGGKREKKKRLHHCSVQGCTYTTGHSKDLTRHMRKHTGEKPFNCDRCSKSFTRYDKLVMHIRIHEGHKPFSCQVCDYAAIDSGSLKKHLRTHSNERPYKCTVCEYSSKSSSQLVVHMRHHTGDSPYLCSFAGCEAAFKTPSDLTRHSRLHSGEKPFKCLHCDYRAAVKSNLNSHMKRHDKKMKDKKDKDIPNDKNIDWGDEQQEIESDKEEPELEKTLPFLYACKFCDDKLESFDLFNLHMENSHPEQNPLTSKFKASRSRLKLDNLDSSESSLFKCSACSASFISEESLRCHMRQHGTVPNKPANVDPKIYSPKPSTNSSKGFRTLHHPLPAIPVAPLPTSFHPFPPPPLPTTSHYYSDQLRHPLPPPLERNALVDPSEEEDGLSPQPHQPSASYSLHELQKMPLVHSTVITENPSNTGNDPNGGENGVGGGTNIIQNHHYDPTTGHMYVITYNNVREGEGDEERNIQEFSQNPINYVLNGNTGG